MKKPNPINLKTPHEIRAAGWKAEARDQDGHLMTTHAPFTSDEEIARYIREGIAEGWVTTVWP